MLTPDSEAELAEAIGDAYRAEEPVLVCGQGSKQATMRSVQAARSVSTRKLTGISLYSPQELVLSARSGTTLAEIEARLAANNQHLIAEPPDYSGLLGSAAPQTIGGVVAAGLSGPRRIAWGATRDHVLGVRAVNGMGETIRSGGRVLKNVTGLDLCKLLTGSHGTLAVMTEITLKVLPAPERRATLAIAGLHPARGVAALSAALGSPYAVSAAAYLPAEAVSRLPAIAWLGDAVTLMRIEDFVPSVAYRAERLRADLAEYGAAEILDDGASRSVWASVRDAQPLPAFIDDAVWRVSVRPSAGPRVMEAVEVAFGAKCFLDWGGGLVWIAGPATEAAHLAVCVAARRERGAWQLFRAPEALRRACEVIPPEPEPLARIGARVKLAFDPKSILNPGRMRAGL
jgi:glycolate oxidase FAD binding subunit